MHARGQARQAAPAPTPTCKRYSITYIVLEHMFNLAPSLQLMGPAPVGLYQLFGVALVELLQQIGAHTRASASRNGVAQREAFQAVRVAHLSICDTHAAHLSRLALAVWFAEGTCTA